MKLNHPSAWPAVTRRILLAFSLSRALTVFGSAWDPVLPLAKETVNPVLSMGARLKKMQTMFLQLNRTDTTSIIYVKHDAPGPEDGTSWAKAYRTIQKAIDAAAERDGAWIWVAQGVYQEALNLKTGAILMGGFQGSEIDVSDRNPALYRTILLGDGKDRVLFMQHKTMVDGFTITGGGGGDDLAGGGILSADWLSIIGHNIIIDNHADWAGGGVYIDGSYQRVAGYSPILCGNLMIHNSAKCGDGASVNQARVMFAHNTIVNHPRRGLEVVTKTGEELTVPTVVNSIIWKNDDDVYNQQFDDGKAIVLYDCFTRSDEGEEGEGVMYADPLFADSVKGDFSLRSGSPCIDAGHPSGPLDADGTRPDLGAFPYLRHHVAGGVPVTFQSSPEQGMPVQVDGLWYPTPNTLSLAPGSKHALLPVLTSQADSCTRYRFTSWNLGGDRVLTYTVPPNAAAVTAVYTPEYFLKVNGDPDVFSPQGEGWYRQGSIVTLSADTVVEASADTRRAFSGWSGTVASNQPGVTFVVNSPAHETVHYSVQYRLQVQIESPAEKSASFSIQPAGQWHNEGDSVAIEALAGTGIRFKEWKGDTVSLQNPLKLRMDGPLQVTAVFEEQADPPGVFDLLSPPADTVMQFTKPVRFAWNRAADAEPSDKTAYHFYIGSTPQFQDNPVFEAFTGNDTTLVLPDTALGGGVYYWGVKAFNAHGGVTWCRTAFRIDILSSVESDASHMPTRPGLEQNHPNPFNAQTQIAFFTEPGGTAYLDIYETSGKFVCRLWQGCGDGGRHVVFWNGKDENGRDVPSGLYLVRLAQNENVHMKKMMFLK